MSVDPYMWGRMKDRKSYVPPFVIGKALDGVAVGEVIESRSSDFKAGDVVASPYGWREAFIATPAELHGVDKSVEPLSVYLGILGMTSMTAWAEMTMVEVKAGDVIDISGAAGAVGNVAGQLAKLHGCRVIGVVGAAHKRSDALAMGADEVIDKSTQDLWREAGRLAPDGFQAVFDANGVSTLKQSYAHLAPMGKLCIFGFASMLPHDGRLNWLRLAWDWLRTPRFNPLDMTQSNRSVLAANLSFLSAHAGLLTAGMRELLALFEAGRLQPPPVTAYALEDAARAQAAIESGKTTGKLVLIP